MIAPIKLGISVMVSVSVSELEIIEVIWVKVAKMTIYTPGMTKDLLSSKFVKDVVPKEPDGTAEILVFL